MPGVSACRDDGWNVSFGSCCSAAIAVQAYLVLIKMGVSYFGGDTDLKSISGYAVDPGYCSRVGVDRSASVGLLGALLPGSD
jgi:hypothetical protein